jgi:hypothetical protein
VSHPFPGSLCSSTTINIHFIVAMIRGHSTVSTCVSVSFRDNSIRDSVKKIIVVITGSRPSVFLCPLANFRDQFILYFQDFLVQVLFINITLNQILPISIYQKGKRTSTCSLSVSSTKSAKARLSSLSTKLSIASPSPFSSNTLKVCAFKNSLTKFSTRIIVS